MFDDIKKDDEKIVMGDPKKVEDPFDQVDPAPEIKSAIAAGKLRPAGAPPAPTSSGSIPPEGEASTSPEVGPPQPLTHLSQLDEWSTKKSHKGLIFSIVVIAVLIGIGGAAYFFFTNFSKTLLPGLNSNSGIEANENAAQPNDTTSPDTNVQQNTNVVSPDALIDKDNDGLTDIEEQAAGTDPEDMDSDADGLSDRDEVKVYQTDPLNSDSDNDGLTDRDEVYVWNTNPNNPDTDGDSYKDGDEVRSGYNPNGSGKLAPEV